MVVTEQSWAWWGTLEPSTQTVRAGSSEVQGHSRVLRVPGQLHGEPASTSASNMPVIPAPEELRDVDQEFKANQPYRVLKNQTTNPK